MSVYFGFRASVEVIVVNSTSFSLLINSHSGRLGMINQFSTLEL